jgi:hypothetical protein
MIPIADEVLEALATAYTFRRPAIPFAEWLQEQYGMERDSRVDVRARVRAASEALGKRKRIRVTPLAVAVPVAVAPVERATWRKLVEDVRAWIKREAVEA